jgi:hypothetical protein
MYFFLKSDTFNIPIKIFGEIGFFLKSDTPPYPLRYSEK